MRSITLGLLLALPLFGGCVVSREKYAASLREAELARGRLADQKKLTERQHEQDLAAQAQLNKEKLAAEQRASNAESALQKSQEESGSLRIQFEGVETALNLWRTIAAGQFPVSTLDPQAKFASAALLSIDPSTQKPNFITSKTGTTLGPEATAQIKQWAGLIKSNNQTLWLLGFADGTPDDLKTSTEFSLLVAKAFVVEGIPLSRLRVSSMGASNPLCQDAPINGKRDASCVAKNNRVQLVLLAEGL